MQERTVPNVAASPENQISLYKRRSATNFRYTLWKRSVAREDLGFYVVRLEVQGTGDIAGAPDGEVCPEKVSAEKKSPCTRSAGAFFNVTEKGDWR
jgi:hypothetical protein